MCVCCSIWFSSIDTGLFYSQETNNVSDNTSLPGITVRHLQRDKPTQGMSEIIVTSLSSSSLTELLSAAVRGDFRRYIKNKTGGKPGASCPDQTTRNWTEWKGGEGRRGGGREEEGGGRTVGKKGGEIAEMQALDWEDGGLATSRLSGRDQAAQPRAASSETRGEREEEEEGGAGGHLPCKQKCTWAVHGQAETRPSSTTFNNLHRRVPAQCSTTPCSYNAVKCAKSPRLNGNLNNVFHLTTGPLPTLPMLSGGSDCRKHYNTSGCVSISGMLD
ncbi:hypothetical protein NQZ68_007711 [Dissostichus eleginoides]|nr:hypothetical protein NQZ68_007711 [Dissostichus eleginoides]